MAKSHHIPGEKWQQDSTWLVAIIMVGSELGMKDQYLTKNASNWQNFQVFCTIQWLTTPQIGNYLSNKIQTWFVNGHCVLCMTIDWRWAHTLSKSRGFKLLTPNPSYLELVHRYVKRTDSSFFWPHAPWVIYPTNMTTSYRIWAVVTQVVCCVVIVLLWVANLERRLLDLTLLDHDDDECTQMV